MATTCGYCKAPASLCGSYANMKEPATWKARLSGNSWLGPVGGHRLNVGDLPGANWSKIAAEDGWGAWDLIYYNFGTRDPREVNWYLFHFVGCKHSADGRQNLTFQAARPGVIYTRKNQRSAVTFVGGWGSSLYQYS